MNIICKYFSSYKKLSSNSLLIFAFLTINTWTWLPVTLNTLFTPDIWGILSYAVLYFGSFFILYLYAGYRIYSKYIKAGVLMGVISIIMMVILNVSMICLYTLHVFESISSLLITIPASFFVTLICMEIWIFISNKD